MPGAVRVRQSCRYLANMIGLLNLGTSFNASYCERCGALERLSPSIREKDYFAMIISEEKLFMCGLSNRLPC